MNLEGAVTRRKARAHGLTVILAICLTLAVVVYTAWSYSLQMQNMNDRALTEARTLAIEILASWNYIDDVQHMINYNADGTYDFKGVYCSIAGKNIANRFTNLSDGYRIRFVREDPRSPLDEPDELELSALRAFAERSATEFYATAGGGLGALGAFGALGALAGQAAGGLGAGALEGGSASPGASASRDVSTSRDASPTLRYLTPLTVKGGCLTCHGDPAGTRDEVGYLREGMQLGDVAGALSISIPLGSYVRDAFGYLARTVAFFLVLVTVVTLSVRALLKRWTLEPLSNENRHLQAVAEAKSDLVSIMSHELRTPLASIIAFTDLWAKADGHDPERERELVAAVKQNSEVLLEMVNNTIDIARIEAGRYELACEQVDVDEVVGAVASVAKPLALAKGIAFACSVDPEVPIVMSDWEALRKILANLAGNAVKYTDRGRIDIDVSYDRAAATLTLAVRDTGVGIREEDLESIFEVFSQGKEVVKGQKRNGSGLGLGLVRNLARLMGGSVEVASELGAGSTFTVRVHAESVDGNDDEAEGLGEVEGTAQRGR